MNSEEKSTKEQVEEIQQNIERYEEKRDGSLNGPTLKVEDHMETAKKYLTPKAVEALSKMGKHLIEQYNEHVGYTSSQDGISETSHYVPKGAICLFTCRVRKDKVEEGVKAISEEINMLAEMGAINSCLTPVSSVDFVIMPFEHPSVGVFCYVYIKPEFENQVKDFKFHTMEGDVGPTLHSLDIDLPAGEFLAQCRLSHQLSMMTPLKSIEARIYDVVGEYLKYLPEGTEFLGYRACGIMDLSLPYELKFRNKLLTDVKRVDLNYVRHATVVKENGQEMLKQFNLIIGIKYLGLRYPYTDGKIVDLFDGSDRFN